MRLTKQDQELLAEAYSAVYCKDLLVEQRIIDKIQVALDIAGIEPTIGSFADGANTVISLLRAAANKEPDERKRHLLNAGISAISLIPFADFIKILKLRKLGKLGRAAAKAGIKGARALKSYSEVKKKTDRFTKSSQAPSNTSQEQSNRQSS